MRILQILVVFFMMSASVVPLNSEVDADQFTFVRLKYRGPRSIWDIDWPASDRNFILQLREHTNINVSPKEKIVDIRSKELFKYPFAYMLEVSRLRLTSEEAENVREYFATWWVYHGGRFPWWATVETVL